MSRPTSNPKSRTAGRRPWMPVWVDDHLSETSGMSALEHSAYVLLLMNYWRDGGLPSDRARLARMARLTAKEWARVEPALARMFGPGWTHALLDQQIRKAKEVSEKRRDAVGQREARKLVLVSSNDASNDTSKHPALDASADDSWYLVSSQGRELNSLRRESSPPVEDVFNARGAS